MSFISEVNNLSSRNDFVPLIDKYGFKTIAEIGVMQGEFLSKLMQSKAEEIWAIDLWDYGTLSGNPSFVKQEEFDHYYASLLFKSRRDHRLSVMKMSSFEAHKIFADNYFDLIYIDADHTYNAVKKDIHNWWNRVRSGGILCGHDYVNHNVNDVDFGVIQAVNEFVGERDLRNNFATTKETWASWFIMKP